MSFLIFRSSSTQEIFYKNYQFSVNHLSCIDKTYSYKEGRVISFFITRKCKRHDNCLRLINRPWLIVVL